jgi:DNA invertase Pin-like site-specific DNA recombinase
MDRQKPHPGRVYQPVGEPESGAPAVGYVRYSSDMQDPDSITTQKRCIEEFAERNGWHIVHWYEEPESSAKYEELEERPIFSRLAGQEFQVVLTYSNDRWASSVAAAYVSLNQLRRKQVWWATGHRQG